MGYTLSQNGLDSTDVSQRGFTRMISIIDQYANETITNHRQSDEPFVDNQEPSNEKFARYNMNVVRAGNDGQGAAAAREEDEEIDSNEIDSYISNMARGERSENIRRAVEAEDVFQSLGHIFEEREKHSAEQKKTSAMSHFDSFLKMYYQNKPFLLNGRPYVLNGQRVAVPNHKMLTFDHLTDDLVGKFATYLGKIAKTKDKKKSHLAYSTARGYFSSFKMFFIHKFHDRRPPEVFSDQKFKMYATALTALIVERCKKANEPLVAQKPCSTKQDWMALATLSAWSAKVEMAEFWHFNNTTTQMAARGNEVAFLQHSNIKSARIQEPFQCDYNLATAFINIWKQSASQDCLVCPHIDSWQLDWYFSNAVLLALSGSSNDTVYICPLFGARANKEDGRSKKNSSGVSSLWTEKFKCAAEYLAKIQQQANDQANTTDPADGIFSHLFGVTLAQISSHAGKPYAVNLMAQCLTRLIQIIHVGGWDVQNAHSLFDYVQRQALHDLEAAKACAGWNTKVGDRIHGAYTNELKDLTVCADKFDEFCFILFHDSGEKINPEVLRLYGFSVLRFFDEFETAMKAEPLEKKWLNRDHPLVQRVKEAYGLIGLSHEHFRQWKADIRDSFKRRNGLSLACTAIADTELDGRNLIDLNTVTRDVVRAQASVINKMAEDIVDLKRNNAELKSQNNFIIQTLQQMQQQLGNNSDRRIQQPFQQRTQQQTGTIGVTIAAAPAVTLSSYSDLMRAGNMSVQEIAFNWFRYDVRELYNQERVTLEGVSGRRVRNHFSIIKSTMHVVVKCLTRYPSEIPSQGVRMVRWEKKLKSEVASALTDTLQPRLGQKALNKNNVKQLLRSFINSSFPVNTPPDIEAFFMDQGTNKGGRRQRPAEEAV